MKKKKKTLIIILSILISIIIIILIITNIIHFKKNKQIQNENIEIVKSNYQELSSTIVTYNQIRTEYTNLSSEFFYDTYQDDHKNYLDLLTRYNSVIKEIDSTTEVLSSKCNLIYKDSEANTICTSYDTIYEKLINLYVADLNLYNQRIDGYNEYKSADIKHFEMLHHDYIDYDKNNKYEGIDNNEKN